MTVNSNASQASGGDGAGLRRRTRTIGAIAAFLVPTAVMTLGVPISSADESGPGTLSFTGGFTMVSFGDARLGNHELEGTLAVGGNISFASGYPIVHSTGLTPTSYDLPLLDGEPTRVLVGGQFDTATSSGVSEVSSRNNATTAQLGRVRIGDVSNLAINPRGSTGLWLSAAGTTSGTEPAIYVPDRIDQPANSVAAPGLFEQVFGDAEAKAIATATSMSELNRCSDVILASLRPGTHAGARSIRLTPGAAHVLSVDASELGDYVIEFVGGELNATTTLVVNVTGDVSSVTLPRFAAVSSPNAANPNTVASYLVWNFGDADGEIRIGGNLVSGTILAPEATVTTAASSPIEGQIIAGNLVTGGGEIHHYAYRGPTKCSSEETTTTTVPETTTTVVETTTTVAESTTTTVPEETTTTTVPESTTTVPEETTTTTVPESTTTVPEETTTTTVPEPTTTVPEETTTTVPGQTTTTAGAGATTVVSESTTTTIDTSVLGLQKANQEPTTVLGLAYTGSPARLMIGMALGAMAAGAVLLGGSHRRSTKA